MGNPPLASQFALTRPRLRGFAVLALFADSGIDDAAVTLGATRLPVLCLNVVYPLVPAELADFCRGKRAVLVLEEGQPEYIEHELSAILRREGVDTPLHGKDLLPAGGEYTTELLTAGLARLFALRLPADEASVLNTFCSMDRPVWARPPWPTLLPAKSARRSN